MQIGIMKLALGAGMAGGGAVGTVGALKLSDAEARPATIGAGAAGSVIGGAGLGMYGGPHAAWFRVDRAHNAKTRNEKKLAYDMKSGKLDKMARKDPVKHEAYLKNSAKIANRYLDAFMMAASPHPALAAGAAAIGAAALGAGLVIGVSKIVD